MMTVPVTLVTMGSAKMASTAMTVFANLALLVGPLTHGLQISDLVNITTD